MVTLSHPAFRLCRPIGRILCELLMPNSTEHTELSRFLVGTWHTCMIDVILSVIVVDANANVNLILLQYYLVATSHCGT